MSHKDDRLQRAWELRRVIHAWLLEHVASSMDEIQRAFPDRIPDTLRNSVAKLRRDGDVVMVNGRANVGRYSAVTREITPVSVIRQRLSEVGKKSVLIARAAHVENAVQRRAERERKRSEKAAEPAAPKPREYSGGKVDPARPWVTVHREGDTAPARDSRGQGSARTRVYVNCFQLF